MFLLNKTIGTGDDAITEITFTNEAAPKKALRFLFLRGSALMGIGTIMELVLRFGRGMILTRLLAPEHLGLMRIVIVASLACEAFTEVGIRQCVIQNKKGATVKFLDTAWWVQAVRGILLYGVGFWAAAGIAQFYFRDRPELLSLYGHREITQILRIALLAVLLKSMLSPRSYILEKELHFGRVLLLRQTGGIFSALLTIALAFYWPNVWVLVIGFTSEYIFNLLASYIVCPFCPGWRLDKNSLKELFYFGRNMAGLPVLTFLAFQADVMILGKMVSTDILGLYGMAIMLSQVPLTLFHKTITPVLLPAFSLKQDQKEKIVSALSSLSKVIGVLVLPVIAFMVFNSSTILRIIYTPEYAAMAIPFVFLSIYAFWGIHMRALAAVFLALGRPEIFRWTAIVRVVVLAIFLYPMIRFFSVIGAAATVSFTAFIVFLIQLIILKKLIALKLGVYLKSWGLGLILSLVVALPTLLLYSLKETSSIVNTLISLCLTLLICMVGSVWFFRTYVLKSSREDVPDRLNDSPVSLSDQGEV